MTVSITDTVSYATGINSNTVSIGTGTAGEGGGGATDPSWADVWLRVPFDTVGHPDVSSFARGPIGTPFTLVPALYSSGINATEASRAARFQFLTEITSPINVTYEGWARIDSGISSGQARPLMVISTSATTTSIIEIFHDGANTVLRANVANGGTTITGADAISNGAWFHWCLERVGTTVNASTTYLYLNGVITGSSTSGFNPVWFGDNDELGFGINQSSVTVFPGLMDDVRVTGLSRYNGTPFAPTGPYPVA